MALFQAATGVLRKAVWTPTAATVPAGDDDEAEGGARGFNDFDLAQATRISVGILWMSWSLTWLEQQGKVPFAPVMICATVIIGMAMMGIAARSHTHDGWRRFDRAAFTVSLLLVALWLAAIASGHAYGTDEVAVGQTSANAVLHGINPYSHDMSSDLTALGAPPTVSTPTLDGRRVDSASYPALSFLAYVPLGVLLGTSSPYALLTDGLFYIALLVLLWRLAPQSIRPLLLVIVLSPLYAGYTNGGVTDVVYLPFALLALYRWDRYGLRAETSWARWMGPVALGTACAVKPTPWLLAPFLAAGIAIEAHRRGRAGWWRLPLRYCVATAATFLVFNLPFIIMDPRAWFHGAFLPLVDPLVPLGHGLVILATSLNVGGGQLKWLTLASLFALVGCITAYVGWHQHIKRMVPLLAMLPLLVATRSLMSYFTYVAILLIISVGTNRDGARWVRMPGGDTVRRVSRVVAFGSCAAVATCVAGFVAARAPMQIRLVDELHSPGSEGHSAITLVVAATNETDKPIRPYFTLDIGDTRNPGFRNVSGPAVLAPHTSATYRIQAVDKTAYMAPGDRYVIEGFAPDPASVSTSPQYTAT